MMALGTKKKVASYSTKQICYYYCYNIQQCIYNKMYLYAVPGCSVNTLHFWQAWKIVVILMVNWYILNGTQVSTLQPNVYAKPMF